MSRKDGERTSKDIHSRVIDAVERFVTETNQVCSVDDIETITKLSRRKVNQVIDHLIGKDLAVVRGREGGRGIFKLFVPKYMWDNVLRSEIKPDWTDGYAFKEERKMEETIHDKREELSKLSKFKRLLYGIGVTLEESVAFSLDFLGFSDVRHLGGDDEHDVEFVEGKTKYICEVGGSHGRIKKDKPKDLTEWIHKATSDKCNERFELRGILFVNPHCKIDLKKRQEALTMPAEKLVNSYNFRLIGTPTIFSLVRQVHQGKLRQEEARKRILRIEKDNFTYKELRAD